MALFQKRERIYLEGFVRFMLQNLLKSNSLNVKDIDKDGLLSSEEIKKTNVEILTFRIALLQMILSDIGKFGSNEFSSEEIAFKTGQALLMALKDGVQSDENARKRAEELLEHSVSYFENLSNINEAELNEKGIYFFLCREFSNKILGENIDFNDENVRNKHFLLFDSAKQVYKNDEASIRKLVKEFKFIN